MNTTRELGVHTETELYSQPDLWRRAAALGKKDPLGAGDSAALIGCGTSYHMLAAWGQLREGRLIGRTDAFIASQMPPRNYDSLLALSRSGTTADVISAIRDHRTRVGQVIGIVGDPDTEIGGLLDRAIVLDFADEESVVQTRFATTALAYLRSAIGDDVDAVADQADAILRDPVDIAPIDCDHLVFLGHSWAAHVAAEAALKIREGARIRAEAYLAEEYRHGPIALAGPGTVVWAMGGLDSDIAEAVRDTGATLVRRSVDAQAELVGVHRHMVRCARARGIDPDRPRFLSRSVRA